MDTDTESLQFSDDSVNSGTVDSSSGQDETVTVVYTEQLDNVIELEQLSVFSGFMLMGLMVALIIAIVFCRYL